MEFGERGLRLLGRGECQRFLELHPESGNGRFKTIEIQAEDASGFIANEQYTTRVDTTAPQGSFDSLFQDNPTGSYLDTNSLNGEIRITGMVEELNPVDSDAVQIRIAEWNGVSETAEILPYTTVTGVYVWNLRLGHDSTGRRTVCPSD